LTNKGFFEPGREKSCRSEATLTRRAKHRHHVILVGLRRRAQVRDRSKPRSLNITATAALASALSPAMNITGLLLLPALSRDAAHRQDCGLSLLPTDFAAVTFYDADASAGARIQQ
jgi:hypothetical protein